MSGKNERKLRQLVRRNQNKIVKHTLADFFDVLTKFKFGDRLKICWMIMTKTNIKELKDSKDGNTGI